MYSLQCLQGTLRVLPVKHRYRGERHIGLFRALIVMAPKKGKAATKTKEGKAAGLKQPRSLTNSLIM